MSKCEECKHKEYCTYCYVCRYGQEKRERRQKIIFMLQVGTLMIEQLQKDVEMLKQQIFNLEEKIENMTKEEVYNWTTACPGWSQPYVHKALELGIVKGDTAVSLI